MSDNKLYILIAMMIVFFLGTYLIMSWGIKPSDFSSLDTCLDKKEFNEIDVNDTEGRASFLKECVNYQPKTK